MSFLQAFVVGVLMTVPALALAYALSRQRALDVLAIQLGAIAAVYAGASLAAGGLAVNVAEITVVFVFLGITLIGLWISPPVLAGGYFAHGLWDVLHHWGLIPTLLPDWYAPFCLGYDWVVGAFIAVAIVRRSSP